MTTSVRPVAKTFTATLERGGGQLNWTIVRIPIDVKKVWGTRGHLRVKGEINGFAFQTSLFPTREGIHWMVVNKKMRTGGRVSVGGTARIRIEPDTEPRVMQMPTELKTALAEEKTLMAYFNSMSPFTRREMAKWVNAGKEQNTRTRRAEQLAERLYLTMEAERGDLPPFLVAAMNREPYARAGWEKMPPSQKRGHLLSIFYYRNPESRARRIQMAIDAMVRYADKKH